MPVGTYGAVKGLTAADLQAVGTQVLLANAYHLTHRPGDGLVSTLGGLHRFMQWNGGIITDSGGYQVFSLRGLQRIDEQGVDYRTHFDGSLHRMTPQSVLQVQRNLGADICMVLDHCPPGTADAQALADAADRTERWARQASELRRTILAPDQLCFGIVQGGTDPSLRAQQLRTIADLDFDGLALGGLSVGESSSDLHATMRAFGPQMPQARPRYIMGIGTPRDIIVAVMSGLDMFDCVIPTRHARNGQLFVREGRVNIRHQRYRDDPRPVDARCPCSTCKRYSRAYLRHLHNQRDPLYGRLAAVHNLYFFHALVATLRQSLLDGTFDERAPSLLEQCAPEGGDPRP